MADCSQKYQTLSQAHTKQTEEIVRLKTYLEGLICELNAMRNMPASSSTEGSDMSSDEFDLVPFMDEPPQWMDGVPGMRDYFDGYALPAATL